MCAIESYMKTVCQIAVGFGTSIQSQFITVYTVHLGMTGHTFLLHTQNATATTLTLNWYINCGDTRLNFPIN